MKYFFPLLFVSYTLFSSACSKRGCTESKSHNYNCKATKDDNTCNYWRDDFLGTYALQDTCVNSDGSTYNLMITPIEGNYDSVMISDGSATYYGEIISESSLVIPMYIGNYMGVDYAINGSIVIESPEIYMDYVFTMNGYTRICTGKGMRQ